MLLFSTIAASVILFASYVVSSTVVLYSGRVDDVHHGDDICAILTQLARLTGSSIQSQNHADDQSILKLRAFTEVILNEDEMVDILVKRKCVPDFVVLLRSVSVENLEYPSRLMAAQAFRVILRLANATKVAPSEDVPEGSIQFQVLSACKNQLSHYGLLDLMSDFPEVIKPMDLSFWNVRPVREGQTVVPPSMLSIFPATKLNLTIEFEDQVFPLPNYWFLNFLELRRRIAKTTGLPTRSQRIFVRQFVSETVNSTSATPESRLFSKNGFVRQLRAGDVADWFKLRERKVNLVVFGEHGNLEYLQPFSPNLYASEAEQRAMDEACAKTDESILQFKGNNYGVDYRSVSRVADLQRAERPCVLLGLLAETPVLELHDAALASMKEKRGASYGKGLLSALMAQLPQRVAWLNAPNCEKCGGSTNMRSRRQPTLTQAEEAEGPLGSAEVYSCSDCGHLTRLRRNTDAHRLLAAPKSLGRCEEWSKVFFVLARALGFDVRVVECPGVDHGFNEVFLHHPTGMQWVHVDCTTDSIDCPRQYPARAVAPGCRPPQVVAMSPHGLRDVTSRYFNKRHGCADGNLDAARDRVSNVMRVAAMRMQNSAAGSEVLAIASDYLRTRDAVESMELEEHAKSSTAPAPIPKALSRSSVSPYDDEEGFFFPFPEHINSPGASSTAAP